MTKMAQRRGTAAQWTTANTVLLAGEIGFETDTGYFKIGDGTTAWNTLLYANPKFDSLGISTGSGAGLTHSLTGDVSTTGTSTALSLTSSLDFSSGYALLNSNSDQTIAGNKNFTSGVVAQSLKSSFASATARDAAITSPTEGMICYLEDVNQVTTYIGSAWFPIAGQMPRYHIKLNSTFSITSGSTSTVTGWTSISNNDNFSGTSGVITVPRTGRYSMTFMCIHTANNTTGGRGALIALSSSGITHRNTHPAPQSAAHSQSIPLSLNSILLTANDTVTLQAYQNSGSTNTLTADTFFTIEYVGP